jgi:hypothetical protein
MQTPNHKTKKRNVPKWLAPVGIGLGVFGISMAAGRAAAKGKKSSEGTNANDGSSTEPIPASPAEPAAPDIVFPVFEGQDGAFMLQELLAAAGADAEWRRFFLATARGESAFTSNVVLGNPALYPKGSKPSALTDTLGPSEASGARVAYQRAIANNRLAGCPWPSSAYSWGSGGWLSMLPANAWYAYEGTSLKCRHPWYLLHPVDHVIVAMEFARRLMGWSAFKADPTWLTLRVGWGNPSAMDEPQARERTTSKFGEHLEALGLSKAWMNGKVTSLPRFDIDATWDRLMGQFDLEPGRKGA